MDLKKKPKTLLAIAAPVLLITASWFLYPGSALKTSAILAAHEKHAPPPGSCTIRNPYDGSVFPPDISTPVFLWSDATAKAVTWLVSIRFPGKKSRINAIVREQQWKPSPRQWGTIKERSRECRACVSIIGLSTGSRPVSGAEISFTTSKDSVGDPLFYREVVLPFSDAVRDPSRIRWRFGSIADDRQPPVVLENLPVCGNCHSFSSDGKTLGMDVDYANDKGGYAVTSVVREMSLVADDIITWSDYKRDETDPTFGLLSQVSPDGRFVASTVKDRSVFVARPDLAFSQLFFPIQGILAIYSRATRTFKTLPGADDPSFVQSNPSWSPDGRQIVFARNTVHRLKNLRDKKQAILTPEECSEFLTNQVLFKYDLYRVPFNQGNGGVAEPLPGASNNGMSNYFPKFSPDGRWIVFCKSNSFMLLQPDSRLFIMPAEGGEPRLMRCNTDRMNSWHTWSSNSRWLVFASKQNTPYTQLFITHVDADGNDAPPVLLHQLTGPDRAANIPEFVYTNPRAIEKIQERFIDDVSLWRSGKAFEEAGDFANAEAKFAGALAIDPRNVKALISMGNILERKGNHEKALEHYSKAARIDSSSALAHINVGNSYYNRKDMRLAAAHYRTALRIDPNNGYAHYNLAETCFSLGDTTEALDHFAQTLRLMPDDALTRFGLGKTLAALGRNREAIVQFTEGVRLLPDDPDGYRLLADALVQAGKTAEAVSAYRKALRHLPQDPMIRLYLANLLRNPEELSEARRLYEEVLHLRPDVKEARDSLGILKGKN